MKKSTLYITYTALGIALYVVLSMTMKIPVISHISLDLGYIAFALMCYHFGAIPGMIVGGAGCVLNSLISSGWFPPGWFVGNLVIGLVCGLIYKMARKNPTRGRTVLAIITTFIAVFVGVGLIKTVIECHLYGIPFAVKLSKNSIAALMDSVVMSAGLLFARHPAFAKLNKKVE